ncbi:MAG: DUF4129 domain-containing protein, partial [Ktedonobacterales bacterium]
RFLLTDMMPFLVLYLLALRVSPAAFGNDGASFLDFSWVSAGGATFLRPDITNNLIPLFLLLAFLWWRATVIASATPTSSTALRRFAISFGLLLLACVGLNAIQPDISDPYSAALTVLVIAEVFCGLLSAALVHLDFQRHEQGAAAGDSSDAQWIGSAILVGLLVVVVALFASLVFNFQSFLALLGYLGPVGQAIGGALAWVANLLALALTQLVTKIASVLALPKTHGFRFTPPKVAYHCVNAVVNGKTVVQCGNSQANSSFAWLVHFGVALIFLTALALIGIVLYFVVRKALNSPLRSEHASMVDEREALDGRSLFAAQLRDLFGGFGRRRVPERDPLQRGTVRYMYRDVLRSAARRDLERTPAETPDEYARRLTATAPLATVATGEAGDLLTLSDAYDDARYAAREPDAPARASLQDCARRLIRLFGG